MVTHRVCMIRVIDSSKSLVNLLMLESIQPAKRNLLSLSRTKDLLMTIEQLQSDALNQLS